MIHLQNALSRRWRPLELRVGDRRAELSLTASPPETDAPWLSFHLNGHPAALQLSWGTARRAAGVALEGGDPTDAALVLEEALADWLDAFETATGLVIRFDALGAAPPGGLSRGWALDAERGALHLSEPAALALSKILTPDPRADLPDLALRLTAEIGAALIPLADLRSLTPGDGLLLSGSTALILEDARFAPAKRTPEGWRIDGPFLRRPPQKDTTMDDLEDLEIRLSFRAGEALVTLADLRAMEAGTIVTLDEPEGAAVEILANGRKIGAGQVISVGGRKAIEIRALFNDG